MAKQTGLFQFTGKLGNVIGYRRNGNYFVRSMPVTVQQTSATRQASRNFGIASRKAKLIRQAIMPMLDLNYDGSLVNRLNKTLIQAKHLEGFRLNKHTGVEKFFSVQPVMQNGRLIIPAQTLLQQGAATHLELTVVATRISFIERRITQHHKTTITININAAFKGAELEAAFPGKGTLFVVLQVKVLKGKETSANRRLMAADIMAATTTENRKRKQQIPDVRKVLPYTPTSGKEKLPAPDTRYKRRKWPRE